MFFPSTVLNDTDHFLSCEFTTPGEGPEAQTRHAKVIGFIESRIKNLLQTLQQQLGGLGPEDGIVPEGNLVIAPESPYARGPLSSVFVITLPCFELSTAVHDAVSQAFISFDLRLADFIEIGGWVNHSSAYQIVSFEQLPRVVHETYAQNFLGTPTFNDKYFIDDIQTCEEKLST